MPSMPSDSSRVLEEPAAVRMKFNTPTERALFQDCRYYTGLLHDVATSGVEHDDSRIGYVTVQIDRSTWNRIQALPRLSSPSSEPSSR